MKKNDLFNDIKDRIVTLLKKPNWEWLYASVAMISMMKDNRAMSVKARVIVLRIVAV